MMKKNFYTLTTSFTFLVTLFMLFNSPDVMSQPTQGATNFSVSNTEGDRFRVNWTRGSGERRIVIASLNEDFSNLGVPANGLDYNANATFGSGDQIGSGNFVVYKGTGTNVTVAGLQAGTTYYFRIYEYDGINFQTLYNTSDVLAGNGTTLSAPTTGPSVLQISDVFGNRASMSWQRGNGNRNLLILRQGAIPGEPEMYQSYNGSLSFGSGSQVGGGRAIIAGTQSSASISSLQPNTWYYARLLEYNGQNNPVYSYATALVDSFLTGTKPTSGSINASTSNIQGERFSINFTAGDGTRRLIVLRQDEPVEWTPEDGLDYNDNASFGQGDNLGNNTFVVGRVTGSSRTITSLTPSTVYHFAIFEFHGTDTNTWYLTEPQHVLKGQVLTLSAPTVQGGQFVFTNISGNSASVSLTAGNGAGRIVLARAGAPVDDIPLNLVSYNSSTNFGSAPTLGSSRIVYRGTGISFNLTQLQPETEYHFAVFEYNGSTGPVYNQNNPGRGTFSTEGAPTRAPSNLTFSNIQGDRINLNYTTGNGIGRIVIAQKEAPVDAFPENGIEYSASTTFGNGHQLGSGNFVIQNSTSGSTNVLGLEPLTSYHFAIIEYNGAGVNRFYMKPDSALTGSSSTLFPPETQASELNFTDITSNSVRINFTPGSGNGRIVLIRPGQPVENLPVDLTSYNFNSTYTSAPSLGTSRIVYRGTASSVNVTSIPPGEYHVTVIEYAGSSSPVYRLTDPLSGQVAVGGTPEVAASNLSFSNVQGDRLSLSFTSGDGTSRMVIVREGAPVNAWPVNGNTYTANSTFGNGAHLGDGNYVVSSGASSSANFSGLKPMTEYHVAVVEFNGTGATTFYQGPAIAATSSRSTLFPPQVPTSGFFANNITGNRMQLTWTRGDGSSRIVIGRRGQEVTEIPNDLTSPNTNATFGNGTNLGNGNFALYSGTGDNFVVTALEPDTTYHFAYVEYNGTSGRVYLRDTVVRAAFRTAPRPFEPARGLTATGVNGDRLTVGFTSGNGARRLVVVKKNGFVDALPQDLTTYATGFYGLGAEIGDGNFVVASGSGSSFLIRGLEPDTRYGVAVFEYDGSNGNERYMVTEYLTGFVKTSSPPTIPTTGLIVNNVSTSAATLSWTNGNGERRMVIMRPFQPVTLEPENLNSYGTSSANFSLTSNNLPDGHKHIYRGTANSVTLSNMQPGVTYHIAIYEYNGASQPVYASVPLRGFLTTFPDQGIVIGGFDAIVLCPGQNLIAPYFVAGNLNTGNVISLELSDINGNFSSPVLLGSQTTTNSQGFVSGSLPLDLLQGTGYRLRVTAGNPELVSPDNGADLTIADSPIPVITVEGDATQTCGEPINLSVSISGYLIQWYKDGEPLLFGTANTYRAEVSGSYQVGIYGAGAGCETLSEPVLLTISETPDFNLTLNSLYCINAGLIDLQTAEPAGGIFDGPGITGNSFDPMAAGVGQHFINYSFTDPVTQCSFNTTEIVVVAPLPTVTISLPFDTLYTSNDPVPLTFGQPMGGFYYLSHDQQVIHTLQPSQLLPGEYWLVYRFQDANSCSGADSVKFVVEVLEMPKYTLTLAVNPVAGGTVTGAGEYEEAEEILLTAVPAAGYVFINWTDAEQQEVSTLAEYLFTMPASDVTLTANFQLGTGISSLPSGAGLDIHPNPAANRAEIRSGVMIIDIRVTDITGKTVYTAEGVRNTNHFIDVSGFQSGVYFIRVLSESGISSGRIMVSR